MQDALHTDVVALHAEVDRLAEQVAARHPGRLRCQRGCADCCVDELTVFEVEAERIRRAHAVLLATGTPGPRGGCAMLGPDLACRVYAERPYVCRTQGLPLRWLEEDEAEEVVEHRDICPLNLEGPALESLAEDDVWLIGPFEARLAELQARADGGELRRVALRDLFARRTE